jgi:hypothetical protein
MPENANPNPPAGTPQPSSAAPAPRNQPDAGHIPITEEMDSAKWTLPPIVPLLIAFVLVGVVVAVVMFSTRAKPSASLAITKVASVDLQGNTMAAIQVKLDNQINAPLWIKNITAEIETPDGKKYSDWLKEELKIPSGNSFTGVAIFAYPVAKKDFDARKSLTLRVEPYDHPALVIVTPASGK